MRSRVKKYVLSLAGLTFILIVAWTSVTHTLPGATTVQPDSFQDQRGKILRFLPHIGQLISNSDTQKCPDILSGMTRGKWKTRVLSNQEQKDIDSYLLEERGAFRMPVDFQRSDGKCGNVTYEYAPLYRHMWFKAICGARGATPCCRDNRCVWAPEEECRCPQCYDERQAVHAEFSQWVAADNRCGVKQFPAAQACSVLRGASVEFVGDSFVRHMFAALVILLSGGEEFSALLKPVPSNIQHICRGMHQFTALQCREYLNETRSLCNNTVQVRYTQVFPSKDFLFVPPILKRVSGSSKTLIVMGLGIHDDFQFDIVRKDFLLPVLNLHQYMGRFSPVSGQARPYLDLSRVLTNFTEANATLDHLIRMDRYEDNSFPWSPMCNLVKANFLDESFLQVKERSAHNILLNLDRDHGTPLQQASAQLPEGRNMKKELETSKQPQVIFQKFPDTTYNPQQSSPNLLWVGIHAPGLLKAPKFSRQTSQGVSYFNSNVRNLLKQWKVPFLDTFSFTDGAVSFDGTHYGWGVNMLKANMLIQYVQEELVGSKT